MTLIRLEAEQRRTQRSGVRPWRPFDCSPAMAAMGDQGLDPHTTALELIFRPTPAPDSNGALLERFVFRVAGSDPGIEAEAELVPGQIAEAEWRVLTAPTWVRDRIRMG
ncbi:MAG: hypothetical protein F4X80_02720 [Chloroflexi bacterium]|nr:hypothetical protein [Chloroflexota bacterium]